MLTIIIITFIMNILTMATTTTTTTTNIIIIITPIMMIVRMRSQIARLMMPTKPTTCGTCVIMLFTLILPFMASIIPQIIQTTSYEGSPTSTLKKTSLPFRAPLEYFCLLFVNYFISPVILYLFSEINFRTMAPYVKLAILLVDDQAS